MARRRYRSKLEGRVAALPALAGAAYEPEVLIYPKGVGRYTPDFRLRNGILLEVKGRFLPSDRTKMVRVAEANPGRDIRFVFSHPNNTLSKVSKTTYAKWAEAHGFKWCAASDTKTLTKWSNE